MRSLIIAVLVLTAVAVAASVLPGAKEKTALSTRSPMFLFALDGLEWSVMAPLVERGKLPVIADLMKHGVYGYLATLQPTYSPVIWTSVATGKSPGDHGIRHFVFDDPGGKDKRYYSSGHRKTKAFWNILSDYDLTVHCVGWWVTYPAEPINGVMVTQTNSTRFLKNPELGMWKGTLIKGLPDQVYPPERQNRVMDLLAEVDAGLDGIVEGIFGRRAHPADEFSQMIWDQTEWTFRADATYARVARDILESGEPFDLMALYIGGIDVSEHRFWQYAFPEQFAHPPDPKQIENFGRVIEDYYVYADRLIGQMLALAPKNASVVIVSDHGMRAVNTAHVFRKEDRGVYRNSAHHLDNPPGVIIASGGPFRSSFLEGAAADPLDPAAIPRLASVLDVLPTILAVKGIPIGEDMDGKPVASIIDPGKLAPSGVRYVPTHDTPEWLAEQQTRIKRADDEKERLEQLRSLGYIK
jgi:predicted AlkP superfamily phosphohydrolase/phosphomutase